MPVVVVFLSTLFMFAGDALAADGVDLRPAATQVVEWMATALGTLATVAVSFGIGWIRSKTKLGNAQLEAVFAERINDVIHRAIDYGKAVMLAEINKPDSSIAEVKFDNFFIGTAVGYVSRSIPDIITYFGLSETRIKEMIMARLPNYTTTP